jgi:hypothetical protein
MSEYGEQTAEDRRQISDVGKGQMSEIRGYQPDIRYQSLPTVSLAGLEDGVD